MTALSVLPCRAQSICQGDGAPIEVAGADQPGRQVDRGRELQMASIEAYRAGDYGRFAALTEEALAVRPGHPSLLYNWAAGLALTGHPVRAVEILEQYADYGLRASPEADSDFDALKGDPRFEAVLARLKSNAEPVQVSEDGFSIPDERFFAEGLTYDNREHRFYVTSLFRRSIASVKEGAATSFAALGDADGRSPMSAGIDSERRLLWVSVSPVRELTTDSAASALVAFDLRSGERRQEIRCPGAFLGDLAVVGGGDVLVSDPLHGMIYRLEAGGQKLVPIVGDGVLSSPQGIVPHAKKQAAYVADYAQGIFLVDIGGGGAKQVAAPDDAMLLGIDGLAVYEGSLIAVQNGVRPARILRLDLSPDGERIMTATVLESDHAAHDEPTTGAVVGDVFWYIANGQWGKLGAAPEGTSLPVVLRLPLKR